MQDFPTPTDVKLVCSFLGLASYYRQFIPNFCEAALTKEDAVLLWSDSCVEVFVQLKNVADISANTCIPGFFFLIQA